MRPLLLATLGLYLSFSASAQEVDPFDILFGGSDTVQTSTSDQTGQDDLSIVRVRLRKFTLNNSVPYNVSKPRKGFPGLVGRRRTFSRISYNCDNKCGLKHGEWVAREWSKTIRHSSLPRWAQTDL